MRLTPARLQAGLDWPAVAGVAPLKGVGFTVAPFISVLAFEAEGALQDQAKLAILLASLVSGVIGVTALNVRHVLVGRSAGEQAAPAVATSVAGE